MGETEYSGSTKVDEILDSNFEIAAVF